MGKRTSLVAGYLFLTLAAGIAVSAAAESSDLGFAQRLRAQEAIERFYYSHQTGATRPFEQVFTRARLERKVRTYLEQSVALEQIWGIPVTAEMLRNEVERMARHTRLPQRLLELYAILEYDPVLVQECLVRPALVDRLIRDRFAFDESIHAEPRRQAEALRQRLLDGSIDPFAEQPERAVIILARGSDVRRAAATPFADTGRVVLDPDEFDRWAERVADTAGGIGKLVETRTGFHVRVVLERDVERIKLATFSVAKTAWNVWWNDTRAQLLESFVEPVALDVAPLPVPSASGEAQGVPTSACEPDSWEPIPGAFPSPRDSHTAVWTGSLMLMWGGFPSSSTGGRYDPVTDSWTPISTINAPAGQDHTAVWTGDLMVVWGGSWYTDTGGRYDTATDTWTATSVVGAPQGRKDQTMVWTGDSMIVWGGYGLGGVKLDSGGRYDPASDTWNPTSMVGAPQSRQAHSAVWTGGRMVVWGGLGDQGALDSGGSYDPVSDTWTPTSIVGAPQSRRTHSAVWTGGRMVVWGGRALVSLPTGGGAYLPVSTGGRYDPSTDTWSPTSMSDVPSAMSHHTAVWNGQHMLIWGGPIDGDSGRYDPSTDTWSPISTVGAPSSRSGHSAVWTGSEMIIWGGTYYQLLNSGGRYDPVTDSWTPTGPHTPTHRRHHTTVWTGSHVIVWGGVLWLGDVVVSQNTGSRYDPVTDTWLSTSTVAAPPHRWAHTAVWTGNEMIVWGGESLGDDTGGRYDPLTDSWTPTTQVNAPSARAGHTAVWTGSRMIVWGGYYPAISTGGLYDPAADAWIATATTNAPSARYLHTAVWTGDRMIVWGGYDGTTFVDTGGLYDPTTNAWTATATTNAPSARYLHTAVWTGDRMIVWGGDGGSFLDTGGRYDLANNRWTSMSTTNAPSPRERHTAIWADNVMVVWGGSEGESYFASGGLYEPVTNNWATMSIDGAPSGRENHTAIWTGGRMVVWGGNVPWDVDDGGRYCVCAAAPYYPDGDGDGFGDEAAALQACVQPPGHVTAAGDCDDADVNVWATPAEVRDLLFADTQTLFWNAPTEPGTITVLYDTIRSDTSSDFVTAPTCVDSNSPSTSSTDPVQLASGAVVFYLVRAENDCPDGLGPLGTDSLGVPRTGSNCP